MLTLHRGSRTIVTDEEFSAKLKWVNPACYMDSVPGDVGLGIDIPVNQYTRTEYGNPERFEKYSSGQDRKFPDVSIRFKGVLLQRGTQVINNASSETYSSWLQSELGVLGTKQRDKFINEMDWPKEQPFVNKPHYYSDSDQYATLQLRNEIFWDKHGRSIRELVGYSDEDGTRSDVFEDINEKKQQFRDNFFYYINKIANGVGVETAGDGCVISPFLYLNYMVTEVFRKNGFFVDQVNNPLNDTQAGLLVYNNYNVFKQIFTIVDKLQFIPNPNGIGGTYEWIHTATAQYILSAFDYANLVPKISLKDFILGLQNYLNIVFVPRMDSSVQVINRNDIPDAPAYDLDAYFLGHWTIGERKDVTLKFIQEFDKNDEFFSEGWHDLSDRRADFKDSVQGRPDLDLLPDPQLGELRFVRGENKVYEYKWHVFTVVDFERVETQQDVLEWVEVSIGPQYFMYGDSEEIEEIKSACSVLSNSWTTQVKQTGNISSAKSLWSDFSLRIMPDYHWLQSSSIDFDGETGIFEQHWKKWANFWKNRLPVEGEFMLPLGELHYVINNITQPFSTRHGKFIIEEMECDFKGSLMGNVKIKGYKL